MIFLVVLKFPFSALSVTVSHVSLQYKTKATKKTKIEESLTALPIDTKASTKQNNRVSQIAMKIFIPFQVEIYSKRPRQSLKAE